MSRFAIRTPYFIVVVALIVAVVGGTALVRMPVDMFPNIARRAICVAIFRSHGQLPRVFNNDVAVRVHASGFHCDNPRMDIFMQAAIDEARLGAEEGGIPIGSVLVHGGRILGRGHNRRVQKGSAILHAEMDALENAGRQPAQIYRESVLYTTLSPCAMCTGAILLYGIPHVVIGENQTFRGEEDLLRSRGARLQVLQDSECLGLMREFLAAKPDLWREDIGV